MISPSESVEEWDDFVAGKFKVSPLHGRQIEGGRIGLIERAGEEDLEGRAEAVRLQFAPELALFATDAVHDLRYVAEVVPEFLFQLPRVPPAVKHRRLVKVRLEGSVQNKTPTQTKQWLIIHVSIQSS